ncbi:MAG TPA: helix-turn-helix transcriptional regulator [Solirubrobacterales bacterium]|nr:helix-turn-helix transcriptional regulator [Solirubrobacterales bacterium]
MPSPSLDPDKVLRALGQAVNEARKEKGLTQEELALRVDLHETYISLIERGQRNPTMGVVRRISHILGVPLSELAGRAEELERKL